MSKTMEKNEIIRNFAGSIHCSQIVVKQWAEELGLDEETAVRMAAPFGGGCMEGDICGCVAGALLMIGAEYGHCEAGDTEGNAQVVAKAAEFKEAFASKCGSLICRELIGYDFSKEEERTQAFESGVLFEKCPNFVNCALELLDEILG